MSGFHLSDCAYHADAPCDCGGLDAAVIARHGLVVSIVAAPRGVGLFVSYGRATCFIEAEQLPTDILTALASATHLPNPHQVVAIGAAPDAVNFNNPRVAVIAQLKALALSQGITGGLLPHFDLDASIHRKESTESSGLSNA